MVWIIRCTVMECGEVNVHQARRRGPIMVSEGELENTLREEDV